MDTDFTPIGERRLRQIVDAVVREGDAAEYMGLEAKSDVDLSKRGIGVAKVAKFILGMANRQPSAASRYFHGYGVMVIGAQQGQAPGVTAGVESHELANLLRPYLGQPGPGWDLARVGLDEGQEVLFVIVDPPEAGDPVFPCRKDYQPDDRNDKKHALEDGAIYVRDRSQTRKALSHEVDALVQRAGSAQLSSAAVDLAITGEALVARDTRSVVEGLLDSEAEKDRAAERTSSRTERTLGTSGLSGIFSMSPLYGIGSRETDETSLSADESIRRRSERAWRRWPACLDTAYALTGDRIRLTLESQTFLKSPEIVVKIMGARALDPERGADVELHEVIPHLTQPSRGFPFQPAPTLRPSQIRRINSTTTWRNEEGGAVITMTPTALRPATPWVADEEMVLVATDPSVDTLRVEWSITAEGLSGRQDGQAVLGVRRVDDAGELLSGALKLIQPS